MPESILQNGSKLSSPKPFITIVLIAPVTLLCGLAWLISMDWPVVHDLPIMLYIGFLMDHFDLLPHAEIFDMNMLGSYSIYLMLGKFFGYEPVALRVADFCAFLVLGALTIFSFRKISYLAGWLAVVIFGLGYLAQGPSICLQREYMMLIPLAFTSALILGLDAPIRPLSLVLAGCGIGAAMTIKPHAGVAALPVLGYVLASEAKGRGAITCNLQKRFQRLLWLALGGGLPLLLCLAVLVFMGVLDDYLDIALNYLPLYTSLGPVHTALSPAEHLQQTFDSWFELGELRAWLIMALLGGGAFFLSMGDDDPGRRRVGFIAGMIVAFACYPLATQQFYYYHWLPFQYWLALGIALVLAGLPTWSALGRRIPALVLIGLLGFLELRPDQGFSTFLSFSREGTRAPEQIASYLRANLRPGDLVQGMDWVHSGVAHGLLMAEAKTATPFIYDFHFYHDVSTDYIKALRQRFLDELGDSEARFIVRGRWGPFPKGLDASRAFPSFEAFLRREYEPVLKQPGFVIYERTH